jgi:hypothetical protein
VSARRDRIARVACLAEVARRTGAEIRRGGAVRLPFELAGRVATLLAAADDVAELARRELLTLEAARDPEPP